MHLVFLFFIFLIGLCIGSFLNCVIYRMELQEEMPEKSVKRKTVSFLRGKSFCPHCKHILSWRDLVPVFSFFFLKGKCRYCSKKISIQYPVIEILTGLIFLLIFNFQFSIFNEFSIFNFQTTASFLFLLAVSCFLIIIFIYDLKHYIIPDKVLFPAITIVFLYRLFENLIINHWNLIGTWSSGFGNFILAGLVACAFFLFFFLISGGRWMGFGDVKLAFLMGLLLGFPNILVALFLAFFLGAIIGVGLIIRGDKKLKSEIPFGPFLIVGTFIAMLWGQEIAQWYMRLFIM